MPDTESQVDFKSWKVDMNLTCSMIIGILIFLVFSGLLTYFVGKYWHKAGDLSRLVFYQYIEPVLLIIPLVKGWIGAESKQKLLFVPDADNKPEDKHKISEPALFRFLLNEEKLEQLDEAEVEIPEMLDVLKDIDKQLKITQVEIHQSSMMKVTDSSKAFHAFIVFKSTSETADDGIHWWSLEKNSKYIVLQRSRNKDNVKDKLEGKHRTKVKLIEKDLKGKGTIQDLFEILWAQQLIAEKYHIKKSNCQSLVTFVGEQITEIGYKYKGYFNYSPPERGWEKEMLDLINILTGPNSSQWHPLFYFILSGNTDLVEKFIKKGNYDINALYNGHSPLHFAILLEKTKMVKHLLQHPMNADPTKRDASGKSALQYAATTTMEAEIFDLLLAHPEVNVGEVDGDGHTALHFAAYASNIIAVQKLIEKGTNPNILSEKGLSPLHVAAMNRDGCPVIDLLLVAKKAKGMGDVNDANKEGMTALHWAALASNEITVEHLIKKGANVNCRANNGSTPLHMAIIDAEDMKIIDLLLSKMKEGDIEQYKNDMRLFLHAKYNMYRLGNTIVDRLVEKGIIKPPSTETSIDLRFDGQFLKPEVEESIDEVLKDENFDINGRYENGHTVLFSAIVANSVNGVRRLLERGADPTIRDEDGYTLIHLAVMYDTDLEILNLLLESGKVDINETDPIYGETALHTAIMKSKVVLSHVDTSRFLLSKGANPNVADINGVTPLHLAAQYVKDINLIDLLLNHPDVDVNCLTKDGRNALDIAMKNKEGNGERMANLLKDKGAVETENQLLKERKETMIKHMRDYSNRKHDEIENFLSDDTISNEENHYIIMGVLLAKAIRDGKVETVRLLIEKGENISERGENGESALHKVSFKANTTVAIDFMLDTGELDINGVDNDGDTPLHYAIRGSNAATNVPHLIRKGADPNIANNKGYTPLYYAAFCAQEIETINLILENEKVNINHRDQVGMTALHHAIMIQNVITTRCLLEKGADPTIPDENGRTPLHVAAYYAKDMDIVKLLLNHKNTNVNYLDNEGDNALHYAMDNKQGVGEAIVNLLSEKTVLLKTEGSKHDLKNIEALVESHMETIRLLIESGQDTSAMTWGENGANALHVAATNEETTELIDALMETGKFNINGVDNDERTPLHHAIKRPKPITINVRCLIEMGADPGIADKNGVTPLHMAARNAESMDLIEILLNTGTVDVNDYDHNGLTARDYARYNKHGLSKKIVDRLTEYIKMDPPTEFSASHTKILVCICCCIFLLVAYVVEA